MNRRRPVYAWLIAVALPLLGGCAGELFPEPQAPPAVYLLEGGVTQAPRHDPDGPSLGIGAMRSVAGYDGADMLYVEQAHRLQVFAHHRWADSPARMLEPLLVARTEHSGLFSAVSGPGSHARADLRLDSELLYLKQVFDGDGSHIALALRASLMTTRRGRQLASQVFKVEVRANPATPYGGVQAANHAADLLMQEVEDFLRRALAHYHPGQR